MRKLIDDLTWDELTAACERHGIASGGAYVPEDLLRERLAETVDGDHVIVVDPAAVDRAMREAWARDPEDDQG